MRATAPFVGRTQELAAVRAVVDPCSTTQARAVEITAEAGAGKTRLVEEALAAVDLPPERLVRLRGGELTATLPFVAVRGALRSSAAALADLPHRRDGRRDQGGAAARAALVDAFAEAIEQRALEEHTVLLVDDAHWVDEASMAVLDLLARQLASSSLRIVLAARPHPEPAGLAAVRRTLHRTGHLAAVRLPPLPAHHAHRITEHLLGGRVGAGVRALVDRAGGNALLCTELGLALRDHVVADRDGQLEVHLPPDGPELDVIEHNLTGLGDDCNALLRDAALLGTTLDPTELALLVDTPVDAVLGRLGPAIAAEILVEGADGCLSFRHDLVRDRVVQAVPRVAAAARHREIATTFAEAGLSPASWAGHLRLADWPRASATAWRLFEQAAVCTADESLTEARALLRHARRVLSGRPPLSFLGLELELAVDTDAVGSLEELLAVLPQHLAGLGPDAAAESVDVLATRALEAVWGSIMNPDSRSGLRDLLGPAIEWGGQSTRDALLLEEHMRAACLHDEAGHVGPMLEITHRLRRRGDRRLWSTALCTCFIVASATEERAVAMEVGTRAVEQLLAAGVRPVMAEALLTSLALTTRAPDEVVAPLLRRLALHERLGPPMSVALGLLHAAPATADGRWDEALALVDDFVDWDAGHGHCNLALTTRATLPVLLYVGVGRFEDARAVLAPGTVGRDRLTEREYRTYASTHHRDRALVELVAGGDAGPDLDVAFELRLAEDVDRCCDRELPLYVALATLADRRDLVDAYDQRVRGSAHVTDEQAALLRVLTDRAPTQAGTVAERALAEHDFLTALAALDGQEDVTPVLVETHQRAAVCGAVTWRDQAAAALRSRGVAVGGGTDGRPTSGTETLTPAERRVLPLILDGLLYREIAEELHNSRRTIESHAASIMRKLGVSSRRELGDVVVHDEVTAPV